MRSDFEIEMVGYTTDERKQFGGHVIDTLAFTPTNYMSELNFALQRVLVGKTLKRLEPGSSLVVNLTSKEYGKLTFEYNSKGALTGSSGKLINLPVIDMDDILNFAAAWLREWDTKRELLAESDDKFKRTVIKDLYDKLDEIMEQ